MWSLRKRRMARVTLACVATVTVLVTVAHFAATMSGSAARDSTLAWRRPSPYPQVPAASRHGDVGPQQSSLRTIPSQRLYSHPFEYLINQEKLCRGNASTDPRIDYLFLISSAMGNVDRRDAIRSTWGRDVLAFGANRLAFLLGAGNDSRLQSAIESEASVHGDVIQESFVDTYRNVTLKSVMMLRWTIRYCPGARFVVKVDDDTYLNAGNFFAAMQFRPGDAVYGKLFQKTEPIRDVANKWHVTPEEFPDSLYPDYVGGSAYVIGGDVVKALYRATGYVKPFPIEDAYLTGSCAQTAGVRRVHVEGFNSVRIESTCEVRNAVSAHYTTAKEMVELRNQLQRTELVCYRLLFDFAYFCYCRNMAAVT